MVWYDGYVLVSFMYLPYVAGHTCGVLVAGMSYVRTYRAIDYSIPVGYRI